MAGKMLTVLLLLCASLQAVELAKKKGKMHPNTLVQGNNED